MPLAIAPITPAIGGEVQGLDLSRPLSPGEADALYAGLLDRGVLFFRDQDVSPAAHLALAQTFGEPEPKHPVYPHVEGYERIVCLDTSDDNPPDTDCWHADLTFRANQPFASILRAVVVPPAGGDTLWASAYAAYDAMPDSLRRDCEGLEAIHDMGNFRNSFVQGPAGSAERLSEAMSRMGCAVKPVIGTGPTGRPFLNVNAGFTTYVAGLGRVESDALLARLFRLIERPEVQVRFRWTPGAVAIWDNRVTQHYAVADYLPHRRVMHRVTVVEDRRLRPARAA